MLNGSGPIMKTTIAEIIGSQKQFQSRAFAILPMTFNLGNAIGPAMGGLLADPAHNFPSWFGGWFWKRYPYLLPNLFVIPIVLAGIVANILFVEETSVSEHTLLKPHSDPGLKIGDGLRIRFGFWPPPIRVAPIRALKVTTTTETTTETTTLTSKDSAAPATPAKAKVFTRPVVITIICNVILMLHCPTFLQLLGLFLSTPRDIPSAIPSAIPSEIPSVTPSVTPSDNPLDLLYENNNGLLHFNGGLGWNAAQIGTLMSLLGITGIILQLTIYPLISGLLGNAGVHKLALLIFPVAYALIPFLTKIPAGSTSSSEDNNNNNNNNAGKAMELATLTLSGAVILARTFAIPAMPILITNAASSRQTLGSVHGAAASFVAVSKCVGPFVFGNLYGVGVAHGVVGLAWWVMAGVVVVEIFVSFYLEEWNTGVFDDDDEEEGGEGGEGERGSESEREGANEREPLIRGGGEQYESVSESVRTSVIKDRKTSTI